MKKENIEKVLKKTIDNVEDLTKNLIELQNACKGQDNAIRHILGLQESTYCLLDGLKRMQSDMDSNDSVECLFGLGQNKLFCFDKEEE